MAGAAGSPPRGAAPCPDPVIATGIEIPADGSHSGPVEIGSIHPNVLGWEIQIVIDLLAADALLQMRLQVFGAWQRNTGIVFDKMNLSVGGRWFVPYARMKLDLEDSDGATTTASSFSLVATPYLGGRPPIGTTIGYGQTVATIGPLAPSSFSVPSGAGWYRVVPQALGIASTLSIKEVSVAGAIFGTSILDPQLAFAPGADPSGGWRRVPPISSGATIVVTNNDAVIAAAVAVQWRYDLTGAR